MGATTDLLYHMVKGIPTFAAIEKRAVAQATALFLCRMDTIGGRDGLACGQPLRRWGQGFTTENSEDGVVGGSVSLTVVPRP